MAVSCFWPIRKLTKSGTLFRECFRTDRDGNPKGIVVIELKDAITKAQAERFKQALAGAG